MEDLPQPLIQHIHELRKRLIYSFLAFCIAFVFCYLMSDTFISYLKLPLIEAFKLYGAKPRNIIFTGITEAFLVHVKTASFVAFFISLPFVSSQFWSFLAPGLYRDEKKVFCLLLFFTPILFILGSIFAYKLILPVAFKYFLSFEQTHNTILPVLLEARLCEYFSFILRLFFAFGLCFELPIIILGLVKLNIISTQSLKRSWRLSIVIIFAIAAILTPPDIFSMISLSLPLCFLYVISIWLATFLKKDN